MPVGYEFVVQRRKILLHHFFSLVQHLYTFFILQYSFFPLVSRLSFFFFSISLAIVCFFVFFVDRKFSRIERKLYGFINHKWSDECNKLFEIDGMGLNDEKKKPTIWFEQNKKTINNGKMFHLFAVKNCSTEQKKKESTMNWRWLSLMSATDRMLPKKQCCLLNSIRSLLDE